MVNYKVITAKLKKDFDRKPVALKEILDTKHVPDFCY